MAKYLTQEWLDEFKKLAAGQPEHAGINLRVQYQVKGGPEGDVDYWWIIEEGKITDAQLGTLDGDLDFTIAMMYQDAAKLQRGDLNPTSAFMQGKMKVSGNTGRMMSLMPLTNSPEWKQMEADVRAMTEY